MMSSCCTLRLNRRSAFSRDSPSWTRTSANPIHLPTVPIWTRKLLQRSCGKSRGNSSHNPDFPPGSEPEFERQLHLPWCIGAGGYQEIGVGGVVAGIGGSANSRLPQHELPGRAGKAAIGDGHALVIAVEQVEALGHQLQLEVLSQQEVPRQA